MAAAASELHRIPSWKEMFDGGVTGVASTNTSPSRPPRGPPRQQTSPPPPPPPPPPPAADQQSGSFARLISKPSKVEVPKEEPPTVAGEANVAVVPPSKEAALKQSRSERFQQIVNPSSLNVNNAQLAMYIAMAHAGLVLSILVFFGIGLLLKGYWKPIQWAVLISMPLREIQSVLVGFWQEPLQTGILETILAVPRFVLENLVETGNDAREALVGMAGMAGKSKGGEEESGPKKKIGFAKLSRWLLTFAVCTVVYEFLGPIVLASTAFVGLLLYAGLTTVLPFFETVRLHAPTLKDKDNLVGRFYSWTIQPVVDALRWSNRGVTRTLAARLPTVVATVLIIMIFIGSLGGSILFTYKVGLEAKHALVNFKSHVDHSNYAETTGLNKWLEDNNVTQQLDSYVGQAYDTLMQQIEAFAEKNNMTEAVTVGKEFLMEITKKKQVAGAHNETEMTTLTRPSHPLVERLQNVKVKLRTYDFGGAYAESTEAAGLGLDLFQIGQDEVMEKVKQTLQKSSDIGKTLVVSGSSLMGRGFYLVLFLWSSIASGAVELINMITQTIIFFSVLYYLITSEPVMNQVLNMVPLSDSVRSRCATVLDHAVSSVLLANMKAAAFQATFTWLLFTWFRIHFLYMATFLAMSQAVFPLFPNWLAAIPGGAQLAMEGRYAEAAVLVILHVYGMDYGLSKIHREIPGHNSYLTGLSIAGGMALFSPALEGAILGPLIMTVLLAAKNLYGEFVLGIPMDLKS